MAYAGILKHSLSALLRCLKSASVAWYRPVDMSRERFSILVQALCCAMLLLQKEM